MHVHVVERKKEGEKERERERVRDDVLIVMHNVYPSLSHIHNVHTDTHTHTHLIRSHGTE